MISEKKICHYALICDDNYAMPTQVTIESIINGNMSNNKCCFHVVTVGLSENSKKMFQALVDVNVKIEIHEVDLKEYEDKLRRINQNTHVTPAALLKFELAEILNEVDVVLYLDSDIIISRDISELFLINLENYYLAAVPELWKYVEKNEMLESSSFYFNSGVLLINLKKFRQEFVNELLWSEKIRLANDASSRTMDQDTFNNICKNLCYRLSFKYNCNPYFLESKYIKLINDLCGTKYENIDELKSDISVIHYVGKEDKPWLYSTARLVEKWEEQYIRLGYSLENLTRKKIEKGMLYYITLFKTLIKKEGLINGIIYLVRKVIKY